MYYPWHEESVWDVYDELKIVEEEEKKWPKEENSG